MYENESDGVELAIQRISPWARGDRAAPMVVTEHVDSLDWLANPATGLVGPDTLVLCAVDRRVTPKLPDGPGTWVRGAGAIGGPGDDVGIGSDFYLETVDYAAVHRLGVVGPTVVRVTSAADAELLLSDIERTLATGDVPAALLHRSVEIGDQCALVRASQCAGSRLERVHLDRAGLIRSSPVGRVLGTAGDDVAAVRSAAQAGDDPCLDEPAAAVIAAVPDDRVGAFVAGLRATRTLSRRYPGHWAVVAGRNALLSHRSSRGPRAGRVLLTDGTGYVLSDAECTRTFRVGRAVAEVVEAILTSGSAHEAAQLLRAHGTASRTADEIEQFRLSCAQRGLELTHAVA